MMDRLAETLARIAEQLGMEGARLWPQIVLLTWTRAIIDFIASLVFATILAVASIMAMRYARRRVAMHEEGDYSHGLGDDTMGWWILFFGAAIMLAIVPPILVWSAFDSSFVTILQPEAVTAERLLKALR
jgi:hypothetical protein